MIRGRRELLAAVGGTLTTTVAGCLNGPVQSRESNTPLYTSFFTLKEFTSAVVGDERQVESAVPNGKHGHTWNPPASLIPKIASGDAFVYLGVEGFQSWVDDALPELEAKHSDELLLVDALEGIDLLKYGDQRSHSPEHTDREHELAVAQVTLFDRDHDTVVAYEHGGHWHDDPLSIPRNGTRSFRVTVEDDTGDEIPLGETHTLAIQVADGAQEGLIEYKPGNHVSGNHITLRGAGNGFTELIVEVLKDGNVVYETLPLETEVGTHDHGHRDHTHGTYDAKFFSDPVLAMQGIETICDGLTSLDPNAKATYEENTAAYIKELEALHREYRNRLSSCEHDLVVLAGHNSFQYLSERYGFDIHTPVGLSPDSVPSSEAIADTVELIESRGIEYVLWDYFDGNRLAETIAKEADTVKGTLMVSPAEGTTDAWIEEGYGDYIGQMAEINLPALEKALGAESATHG